MTAEQPSVIAPCRITDGVESIELEGPAVDATIIGQLLRRGTYEPHVIWALTCLLRPDSVMLDIGANIGVHTLVAAQLAYNGNVYAFEPARESFDYLQRNIARESTYNVKAYRTALSARAESIELSYSPEQSGSAHRFIPDKAEVSRIETVDSIPLDSWVAESGIAKVDVIKIDVEGAELDVLEGAARTIRRDTPSLIVECNPAVLSEFSGESYRTLFYRLKDVHSHIYCILHGRFIRLLVEGQLRSMLAAHGKVDLLATTRKPLDANGPSRARVLVNDCIVQLHIFKDHNRWRVPTTNFIIDPVAVRELTPSTVTAPRGTTIAVSARVVNKSRQWLSSDFAEHPVFVSYHWLDEEGDLAVFDGARTILPRPVGPGREIMVRVRLDLPSSPGRYVGVVTLVQEAVAWLDHLQAGSATRLVAVAT